MSPEQQARQQIDAQLLAAGWFVQDYTKIDFSAGRGIALREVPLKSGTCDYLLLVDRKPVGVVEAKKKGTLLSGVAEQSGHYAENLPDFLAALLASSLPFLYESTGVETFFRDERDPDPRSRPVFSFHRPETLAGWLTESDTLRTRLRKLPPLVTAGMRQCQVEAITSLEESFADAHPRALIQMATGSGKTFAACAFTYRLIKYAGARRVLFLVDRSNLGRQATAEFQQFVTPDTGRKFTELYNVQHLTSNALDPVCRVTICTIQRLYSMLRGEELPEDAEEMSTYEISAADGRLKEVAYNPAIPIEMFDFVVTDECHRSIYNLWRQVLEYFDAFLIGLTATPSKQTIGFFNQNLVTEYNHERAVADGVNVGYEVYRIKTQVTEQGGKVEKGFYVDKRSKLDRSKRWEQLDEDLSYAAQDLDRSVVVPSQIRTVLQTFKDALFTELFPGRTLVPKTLIFCKDDSHAEDVVHICREVFGKGNDFARKITYKTYNPETKRYEKSETLIQEFRTSPQLRIAVTVDMIATGTDIKPLECLLFLRDVRSRVYFEQMKGRGTRVLTPTDLQAVSGADARAKTHFVIVDAVGVCESDKTDSRPLEKQPTVKFDKLLLGVALGKRDEDTLTTLAGRLARLERELNHEDTKELKELTGGKSLGDLARNLLNACDPDYIHAEVMKGKYGTTTPDGLVPEPTFSELGALRALVVQSACAPFDKPALRDTLVKLKQQNEQTIDTVTADVVTHRGYDAAAKEKAANLLKSFRDYIEQHKTEITALQILYSRPYKQRLTEKMLKELETKLKEPFGNDPVNTLWRAFELADVRPHPGPLPQGEGESHPIARTSVDARFAETRKTESPLPGGEGQGEGERKRSRSAIHRFADLVALVRFALEQQPVLAPFADSVSERFNEWLMDKAKAGVTFTPEQLAWLHLIRGHIATSLSIEPDDLELSPFNQRGGLGKAHQLFGDKLPELLDELNTILAA
jgi:type I restriction enzyme R subunit